MDNNIVIKVENLTKVYHLYDKPQDRLKEALNPFKKSYHHDFYAMNDVSFEIKKGETVGIIGKNGAGKSTLLKMITGVLTPTSGSIEIKGKVASLLELGAGFNPEMSGMENIYLNGVLMGFSKEEMDRKVAIILEFADIGEFIYQPTKMYSSGMFARLAFSIAINVDADVLIIDEVLSVGDMRFQQKSIRKMKEFQENGTTILFVSHDMGAVLSFCTKAIWIDGGEVKDNAAIDSISKKYTAFMAYGEKKSINSKELAEIPRSNQNIKWMSSVGCDSFGEGGAEIIDVAFFNEVTDENLTVLHGGEEVCFCLRVNFTESLEMMGIGFRLTDKIGNHVFSLTSYVDHVDFGRIEQGLTKVIKLCFTFPKIKNGEYFITTAISEGTQINHYQCHWVNDILQVVVSNEDILRHSLGVVVIENGKYKIE